MKKLRKMLSLLLVGVIAVTSLACGSVTVGAEKSNQYNVIVLNFDPIFSFDNNKRQHELLDGWNDPHWLAEQFSSDMKKISYNYADYNITEWIDLDELPKNIHGKQYTLRYYYDTLMTADKATNGAYWQYSGWEDFGFTFDYDYYLNKYNIYDRVNKNDFQEVWIFTGPMVGVTLNETKIIGKNAYWCNGEPIEYDCKPFVVYGFNYERGVGEMLEDAGHRAESIMDNIMGYPDYSKNFSDFTDWEKFTAYEKVKHGKSGVGSIHYSPNSDTDYDWGNYNYVYSYCNDWINYPNLTAEPQKVNCEIWGYGDIREHHKWWFSLFPHANGINENTGFYNNWWYYFTLDYINNPSKSTNVAQYSSKTSLDEISISSISSKAYTSKAIKPSVTVKDGTKTLVKGTDYTLSYKNNTNIGTATVTITGKGSYTGSKDVTFKIVPPKTTLTAKKSNGKYALSWKAVDGITKYQIQYSTDGGKTYKTAGTVAASKTSTSLKLDTSKSYTFRIRSYKTVDGKKYYSSWSKAVTVK